jgi:hypothetical protein
MSPCRLLRIDDPEFRHIGQHHRARRNTQRPAGQRHGDRIQARRPEFHRTRSRSSHPFNHAYSIQVACDSQEELDRIWEAFLDNGGQAEHCGWLRDRWGLSWQIVPRVLGEMISDANRERAKRVTEAMLAMVKFDIAALERAHRG